MENTMDFHRNAVVATANGREIGRLERMVFDQKSRALTHVVVRIGALLNRQDKVVPIGMIAETSAQQVRLTDEAGDLEASPMFEEERVVAVTGESTPPEQLANPTMGPLPQVYGAPVMGTPLPPDFGQAYKTQQEQNIPEGTVALKWSAPVTTSDGKTLGNVDAVRARSPGDEVTHILVSNGLLTKEGRWMPMDWVHAVEENQVTVQQGRAESLGHLETT